MSPNCFALTIITYSLLALECKDSFGQVDTYEELLQHLIHFHKICRKFYETTQAAQPPPTPNAEQPKVIDLDGPEVIDLDADEEVNVTAPEAMAMVVDSDVVEIDPQVSSFNRSSRRKRGMASNLLFLHFPYQLSYGYLRFEGNG